MPHQYNSIIYLKTQQKVSLFVSLFLLKLVYLLVYRLCFLRSIIYFQMPEMCVNKGF